jgi:succinyl-CoA synthetase alpha subunit
MSILVNKDTRLLVQGITGHDGLFHTRQMVAYGTNIVAGVTPGIQVLSSFRHVLLPMLFSRQPMRGYL